MFDRFRRFTSRNESGSSSSQPTTGSTQPTSISSGQSQSKKKSKEEETVAEDFENIGTEDAPDVQQESGSKRKASLTPDTETQSPHKKFVETFEDSSEASEEFRSPKSEKKRRKKSHHKSSPKDPTERKHLHVEDLDVERSYVNDLVPPPPAPKPERPKRWKHRGDEPLTDPHRLPKGWTTLEPDLDEL